MPSCFAISYFRCWRPRPRPTRKGKRNSCDSCLVLGDTSRNPEAARRGIEHAAALVEGLRSCLASDFPEISPKIPRILVCTQQPSVETGLPRRVWQAVERELLHAGVEFLTGRSVKQLVPAESAATGGAEVTFETMRNGTPVVETLRAGQVIWHATPQPGDFLTAVIHAARVPADNRGWALIQPGLSATPFDNLFLAGSAVSPQSFGGHTGPEFEPSRHQSAAQGKHVATTILARLRGEPAKAFEPARRNPFLWTGRHRAHGALHPLLGSLRVHGWLGWLGWLHLEMALAELGLSPLRMLAPGMQPMVQLMMPAGISGANRAIPPAMLQLRPHSTATPAGPGAPTPPPAQQAPRPPNARAIRARSRGATR